MAPSSEPPSARVLIVNESPSEREEIVQFLRDSFPKLVSAVVETEPELLGMLESAHYDFVISENRMSWGEGLYVLHRVLCLSQGSRVILLSEHGTPEECARAMRAGLHDFIGKTPGWKTRLALAIRSGLETPSTEPQSGPSRQRDELIMQHRELKAVNDALEQQIEERSRVADKRAQQLRMLASELTKAEERERRRLAQMLHDDLQQMLVAARMHISAIKPETPPNRIAELMRHVDDLVDRSIRLSRNLTHRASPPVLYDAGLAPAFEWLGRQFADEHGLEVIVDCDDDAQPESQDTRILLYQACRELLFNVVKHAGATQCKLSMHRAGLGDVQVSVCDSGKGFDEGRVGEVNPGDGFGLFSIRERLELIGGRMEIESVSGEGSCVRLFAPVAAEKGSQVPHAEMHRTLVEALEQTAPLPEPKQPSGIAPIRVLLADDHRIIRASLAGLLKNRPGIEVVGQAGDGQQTIDKAHALRPDVIIMDVTMPVIDGVEATRRLSAEMPDVAIIALSMHEKEDMQQAMRDAGAVRYLTKDGPPELLIAAIRSTARGRRTATPKERV